MRSSMQMNRYLLNTDSRGNYLEGRLNTKCKRLDIESSFQVLILSGRNVENMLKDAEYTCTVVYILWEGLII